MTNRYLLLATASALVSGGLIWSVDAAATFRRASATLCWISNNDGFAGTDDYGNQGVINTNALGGANAYLTCPYVEDDVLPKSAVNNVYVDVIGAGTGTYRTLYTETCVMQYNGSAGACDNLNSSQFSGYRSIHLTPGSTSYWHNTATWGSAYSYVYVALPGQASVTGIVYGS